MATKKAAPKKTAPKKAGPARGQRGTPKARNSGRPVKGNPKGLKKKFYPKGRQPTPTRRTPQKTPAPQTPAAAARPDPSRPTALAVARAGLDKKAEDVTVFDVRGISSYADYLVLMTAESDRQAAAIADNVDEQMKAAGLTRLAVEGYETGRWIIVDYGDVVAHVMGREARTFYDLEGLWADAPRFPVKG